MLGKYMTDMNKKSAPTYNGYIKKWLLENFI